MKIRNYCVVFFFTTHIAFVYNQNLGSTNIFYEYYVHMSDTVSTLTCGGQFFFIFYFGLGHTVNTSSNNWTRNGHFSRHTGNTFVACPFCMTTSIHILKYASVTGYFPFVIALLASGCVSWLTSRS